HGGRRGAAYRLGERLDLGYHEVLVEVGGVGCVHGGGAVPGQEINGRLVSRAAHHGGRLAEPPRDGEQFQRRLAYRGATRPAALDEYQYCGHGNPPLWTVALDETSGGQVVGQPGGGVAVVDDHRAGRAR